MAENKIIFVFLFTLFSRSAKTLITDRHCLHERRAISDVSTFSAVCRACDNLEEQNIVHDPTKQSQLLLVFEDHVVHEF